MHNDEDLHDFVTGVRDVLEAVKPRARPCLINRCIDESDLPRWAATIKLIRPKLILGITVTKDMNGILHLPPEQ